MGGTSEDAIRPFMETFTSTSQPPGPLSLSDPFSSVGIDNRCDFSFSPPAPPTLLPPNMEKSVHDRTEK